MTDNELELRYAQALEHQLAGRFDDAKAAYLALLHLEPAHPEASHNLGMLEYACGASDTALSWLMNAIEARPSEEQFWLSLIEVLHGVGAEDHLAEVARQAATAGLDAATMERVRERCAMAASPVASLAPDEGPDEAEEIRIRTQAVIARSAPGGRRQVAASRPLERKLAERLLALFHANEFQRLEELALRITRELPRHPSGWHFLGEARLRLGQRLEALKALLKANELFPGDPQLLNHLGRALTWLGYYEEADGCFAHSLMNRHPSKRKSRSHIETLRNYVGLKVMMSRLSEAEQLAREALKLAPEDGAAHFSLAQVYLAARRQEAAIECLQQAIRFDPDAMEAYQDLGLVYFQVGRLEDSLRTTELALARNPNSVAAFSNLLFFLTHDERQSPELLFRRHVEFGERFEAPLQKEWRPHENDPNPERKLRVGFVSGDFWSHPVAQFFEPILIKLDREKFTLFGFHNSNVNDGITQRLRSLFDVWISVSFVSDRDLAEIVRAAKIDILIDLSGHTAGHRLMTFARKPAPVQMSWIGYVETTGLKSMDYYVTDRYLAPPGCFDEHFTEKLLRLNSAIAFNFDHEAPTVGPAPVLRNGFVTFGSFNRTSKISSVTLDLWSALLSAVPNSRLLIGSVDTEDTQRNLTQELVSRQIDAERLRFLPRVPFRSYLEAHNEVDVLLDTFPYNAGTTALHSLWMGVPLLTIKGKRMVSNIGASLMSKAALSAFVAEDGEDFVSKGAALARQPDLLNELRSGLRERLARDQNFDAKYVTRCLEDGFRSAWGDWCASRV